MTLSLQSVLGPIDPFQVTGLFDAHNHIWIERVHPNHDSLPVLDNWQFILAELRELPSSGLAGLADCQPGGCGRDGNRLAELASLSGSVIVGCTGFHLRRYYPVPSPFWDLPAETVARMFVDELQKGMGETLHTPRPVRAGFIKVAVEASLADTPQAALEASAFAALQTGAAIEIHTEKGAQAEEILAFYNRHGLSPDRLVLCHMDKRPDIGLHRELARAGVMLEYDTFFRPKYEPELNLWPLLLNLIRSGLEGSIALATDLADSQSWSNYGGSPGLSALARIIFPRLLAFGVTPETARALAGGNILRRLSISS